MSQWIQQFKDKTKEFIHLDDHISQKKEFIQKVIDLVNQTFSHWVSLEFLAPQDRLTFDSYNSSFDLKWILNQQSHFIFLSHDPFFLSTYQAYINPQSNPSLRFDLLTQLKNDWIYKSYPILKQHLKRTLPRDLTWIQTRKSQLKLTATDIWLKKILTEYEEKNQPYLDKVLHFFQDRVRVLQEETLLPPCIDLYTKEGPHQSQTLVCQLSIQPTHDNLPWGSDSSDFLQFETILSSSWSGLSFNNRFNSFLLYCMGSDWLFEKEWTKLEPLLAELTAKFVNYYSHSPSPQLQSASEAILLQCSTRSSSPSFYDASFGQRPPDTPAKSQPKRL